ncbi:ABC transporter permease [Ktedonobacter robiniae]|uniref:ABC transporter permease n=1 Tax=Ktedonobacter robiniae TaxID=2778365 RepID=A0ABQ3UIB5_9CHLR|nr:FtsX-like permease family protein [Ktedonobacter robiniae]GHO52444.1 hypothetical protein KSB_09190 [Ktedonobacter robiniae]
MKASMYFNYTSRSLVRGGQRTVLALFCVAVGVMAIVALQLVGLMINNAFTSNVRDANGGDIAVTSNNQPFNGDDLKFFDTLKKDKVISNYTPVVNAQASSGSGSISLRQSFSVRVVDPKVYPLGTPLSVKDPKNATVVDLLQNKQIIVTQAFVDQYHKKVGDELDVRVTSSDRQTRVIKTKIAGIVDNSGVLSQAGSVALISLADYKDPNAKVAQTYDTVDVSTVDKAHMNDAAKKLRDNFPIANVRTVDDAVKNQQATIDNIRKFLEIAGLLALLIGGVGIVNTMQVLLSRRKTEIAMLKTTGYRRFDLYLLFGLEAALLGLVGGVLGAATSVGVSYLVRNIVQNTFLLNIPFILDYTTIVGGVIIGVATSLIFGLLPIVQAANIRPLNVIRDLPEGKGAGSLVLTVFLLLLLSVLFCALSIVILNNDIRLGIGVVYGTFIFLALLSVFFGLIVWFISRLPVPERFSVGYLSLIVLGVAFALFLYWVLPNYLNFPYLQTFGLIFLVISLLGLLVVVLPRTWKANVKMALRNIGRQRARTTTTMLALFVGIFTIGLILILGQDLRDQVNDVISKTLNYNVVSITSGNDTQKLQDKLSSLNGLSSYQRRTLASTVPVAINNKPLQEILPSEGDKAKSGPGSLGRGGALYFLSGVEGYDVGNNQFPSTKDLQIIQGRNLNASDEGTDNILIASELANLDPFHLKVGDKITLAGQDRVSIKTVTVVGVYQQSSLGGSLYPLLGTRSSVKALSPGGVEQSVFYMKIDANKLNSAVDAMGKTVPDAFVLNLANISDFVDQLLNDILLTLTTIASLSLVAGVIIIANAVALAMLERRRELGILKSVGYTSSSILSEVMIENGVVGGTGALLAMLLVTGAISVLGALAFGATFGVSVPMALALILGSAALAILTSAIVAWGAVRVRPLEVLRYE